MPDKMLGILGDRAATGEQIRQAWEQATVNAMETHRETGVPMAIWDWENHHVLLIPAEEIVTLAASSVVNRLDVERKS